jgi:hypothetical protein
MFMWGREGKKTWKVATAPCFHVGFKLLAITLVFFYVKTSLVEEKNPFSFYDGYKNLQCSTT